MAALFEKQDCATHLCGLFLFYVLLINIWYLKTIFDLKLDLTAVTQNYPYAVSRSLEFNLRRLIGLGRGWGYMRLCCHLASHSIDAMWLWIKMDWCYHVTWAIWSWIPPRAIILSVWSAICRACLLRLSFLFKLYKRNKKLILPATKRIMKRMISSNLIKWDIYVQRTFGTYASVEFIFLYRLINQLLGLKVILSISGHIVTVSARSMCILLISVAIIYKVSFSLIFLWLFHEPVSCSLWIQYEIY